MAGKVKTEAVRQYQRYDSIAEARRHGQIQKMRAELRSGEKAMAAQPVNTMGFQDPGRAAMTQMIMDQVEQKRAQIRDLEALTADDLVVAMCQDILAQQAAPLADEITINGEPLYRGARVQGWAPGMQNG
jgi:rubrerythrin